MNVNRSPAPDVAGSAEVRAILGGISRTALVHHVRRPDFPAHRQLEIGRVWDRAAIRAYEIARKQPRRRAITKLVAHYRRHGKLNAAARHADIHPNTARRWLRELEIPTPREAPR